MYSEFIQKLDSACAKRKIGLEEIGCVGKNNEYPLFKVTFNANPNTRKTVCFSAGFHGEEIAGPLAILEFVKNYDPAKFPGIKIILLPVANPTGFDEQKRLNHLNEDFNFSFCDKKLTNENKILYKSIEPERIFFFHALHEDAEETRFYLYNFEKKKEKVYRDIIRLAKKYFMINTVEKIWDDDAVNGLVINRVDGSFEDRMFHEGVPFSMCTETPGMMDLLKRIDLNVEIMNFVVNFCSRKINP